MTLQLPTEREQRIAERAVERRDVDLSSFVLTVDGEDIADEIVEGEWGQDDSGATSLDFTLGAVLPRRLEEAPVEYWVDVRGVRVPLLYGPVSSFEVGEDRVTTDPFWAATPAALWARTTLDEPFEFSGMTPEQIARVALSLIPYPRGGVEIAPLEEPILSFTKAAGTEFKKNDYVSSIIDALLEETTYVFRDDARGHHFANPAIEVGGGGRPERTFDASEVIGWKPPSRADLRYNQVVVFRTNPDGQDAYRERAPIAYRGQRAPFQHHTFYVELDEVGSEGATRAKQLAYDLSRKFSRGVYRGETNWPNFDPFVERQDVFGVYEDHRDMDGSWQRFWMLWIENFKHQRGAFDDEGASEAINTRVGYAGTILEEDLIDVPTIIFGRASSGVVKTKISAAPPGAFKNWGQTDYRFDELTQPYGELP